MSRKSSKPRKSSTQYRAGDVVRSHYRGAGWIGVVTDSNEAQTTVVPMIDSAGHPQRKRYVKTLHADWLTPATLDPEQIRQDWI